MKDKNKFYWIQAL